MANNEIHFDIRGLDGMERDFFQLSTRGPFDRGRTRLDHVLRDTEETVRMSAPVGTGDYRRPAGALRDSVRSHSEFPEEIYNGIVMAGYEDDRLPYAQWARWKHLRKTGEDWFGEPIDAMFDLWDEAVNAPFDEVWGSEYD